MDAVDKTELKRVILKEIKEIYPGYTKLKSDSRDCIVTGVCMGIERYFKDKGGEHGK